MKNSEDSSPQRFLVISTTGIGDTLMGTPALRALRKSFPHSEIHFLVNSKYKELVIGNPHIDRILEYRNNPLFRALLFLKTFKTRYDYVLIFHANEDIWKILKKIRYGTCYNRQSYVDEARRVFSLDSLPRHSIQRRLALVERVGGKKSQDYRYEYKLPEDQVCWAEKKLAEWGIKPGDCLVGMQVGAADRYKCWPLESFAALARYLQARYGAKIYLNLSPKEKGLVGQFSRFMGGQGFFYHAGSLLSQSAALIQRCSLFISNDTGPMHMAIGLKVPLIALFCPTDADVTGPLAHPQAVSIQKKIPCNPCRVRGCTDNFCMKQISVVEVCRATDRLLE